MANKKSTSKPLSPVSEAIRKQKKQIQAARPKPAMTEALREAKRRAGQMGGKATLRLHGAKHFSKASKARTTFAGPNSEQTGGQDGV